MNISYSETVLTDRGADKQNADEGVRQGRYWYQNINVPDPSYSLTPHSGISLVRPFCVVRPSHITTGRSTHFAQCCTAQYIHKINILIHLLQFFRFLIINSRNEIWLSNFFISKRSEIQQKIKKKFSIKTIYL